MQPANPSQSLRILRPIAKRIRKMANRIGSQHRMLIHRLRRKIPCQPMQIHRRLHRARHILQSASPHAAYCASIAATIPVRISPLPPFAIAWVPARIHSQSAHRDARHQCPPCPSSTSVSLCSVAKLPRHADPIRLHLLHRQPPPAAPSRPDAGSAPARVLRRSAPRRAHQMHSAHQHQSPSAVCSPRPIAAQTRSPPRAATIQAPKPPR